MWQASAGGVVVLAIFEAHLVELEQLTDTDDNGREYAVEIDLAAYLADCMT